MNLQRYENGTGGWRGFSSVRVIIYSSYSQYLVDTVSRLVVVNLEYL
jgi:hypothetical protein